MEALQSGSDVLLLLMGAAMVLAMHAGFAFLEMGTVRHKHQVNALVKILTDFSMSPIAYFFVGYGVAYGVNFLVGAEALAAKSGFELVNVGVGEMDAFMKEKIKLYTEGAKRLGLGK